MSSPWISKGKGSSKDLYLHSDHPEHVFFEFTDRVSVFDYGALDEKITHKGNSLKQIAELLFEKFDKENILTCYDKPLSQNTGRLAMKAARHPKFFPGLKSSLEFIPLEILFRWGVPTGSSLLKRRPDLKVMDRFLEPLIEYSTKLESSDRLVSLEEAQKIAGPELELSRLTSYAVRVARVLKKIFQEAGLELWDGKIECAFDIHSQEIRMVDALTPDELRVTLPGYESVPLSKELLRSWLGHTDWAFYIRRAKESRKENWKENLSPPPRLGPWRLERLSSLYESFLKCLQLNNSEPFRNWILHEKTPPQVCIVGSGGREVALKWKLSQEGVLLTDQKEKADLVWVSPDAELAAGLVDELSREAYWTFGPTRSAARVEWSKEFGREIAQEAGIPIPRFATHFSEIRNFSSPPVIKMDGLAAGKGVLVPSTWEEAESTFQNFSKKGKVLCEERLSGFEASAFFALESTYGGRQCHFLGSAKDFKRRFPGDEGPNTGGMGAYAPHPQLTSEEISLFQKWAESTALVLEKRGLPFNGILYLGLMKDDMKGWQLLEYNARLGDPETEALVLCWPQKYLRSLLSLDLVDFASRSREIKESVHSVLCLALVHPDYPENTSKELDLPEWNLNNEKVQIFRTSKNTGRLAYLVAQAPSLREAGDRIFEILLHSPWKNHVEWRPDILS